MVASGEGRANGGDTEIDFVDIRAGWQKAHS